MTRSLGEKPQIINHITKNVGYTAHDIKWLPLSPRLCVLGESVRSTGMLQIYELEKGDLKLIFETEKDKAFKCGTLGASSVHQRHLATVNFDGYMTVWDLECTNVPVYRVQAHEKIVNAIDGCGGRSLNSGPPEIVTGGRDGTVKVWDVRQKEAPVAKIVPKADEKTRECWTVTFGNSYNNEERYISAGYDNGDVKIFDLRNMSLVWDTNLKNGVCSVQFDRWDIKANKLLVSTLESTFHVFDLRTFHSEKGYANIKEKGSDNSTIWTARHLPQNRDLFMTSSGKGVLSMYKYNYPSSRTALDENKKPYGVAGSLELLNNASVSDQPVSSFDWSPDKLGLCAYTSYDQSIRVGIVTKLNQF